VNTESRTDELPTRWRAIVVTAALAVNVVVFWVAVHGTLSEGSPETAASAPSSRTRLAPAPTTEAGPSEDPTSSPDATPDAAPDAEAAVLVTATPDPTGILEVEERVRPSDPVSQLVLQLPPTLPEGGETPQVLGLTLSADGKPVAVPATPRRDYLVVLPAPASDIVLRYRLAGVVEVDPQAPAGRALVQLRPLTSASMATSTAVVEIAGVRVRNLVCPDRPLAERLCARRVGDVWRTAPLPNGEATVLAQIDLPESAL
jgi:hypothetical protein